MRRYGVMRIGKKLETMMAYRGFGQPKMAELTGKSQSTVSNWVTGKSYPKLSEVQVLAKALRTTVDYLVVEGDERTPEQVEDEMNVRKMVEVIGWDGAYRALAAAITARDGGTTHGGVQRHDQPERTRGAG